MTFPAKSCLTILLSFMLGLTGFGLPVVEAQAQPSMPKRWFIMSLGPAIPHEGSWGLSMNFGARVPFQLGLHNINDADVVTFGAGKPSHITGVHALAGKHLVATRGLLTTAFVGPALIYGRKEREPENTGKEAFVTAGLAANTQFFLVPHHRFGLGIDLYANLNPVSSGVGARVGILIGSAATR